MKIWKGLGLAVMLAGLTISMVGCTSSGVRHNTISSGPRGTDVDGTLETSKQFGPWVHDEVKAHVISTNTCDGSYTGDDTTSFKKGLDPIGYTRKLIGQLLPFGGSCDGDLAPAAPPPPILMGFRVKYDNGTTQYCPAPQPPPQRYAPVGP